MMKLTFLYLLLNSNLYDLGVLVYRLWVKYAKESLVRITDRLDMTLVFTTDVKN